MDNLGGGSTPSPAFAALLWALGRCYEERVPWWAAEWLAQGWDGDALRTLAGLNGKDSAAVRDLMPAVFAELAVTVPGPDVAVAAGMFTHIARMWADGRAGEQWVAQKVEEVLCDLGYPREVMDLPLGALYRVADEWQEVWGRSEVELRAAVGEACRAQLRAD